MKSMSELHAHHHEKQQFVWSLIRNYAKKLKPGMLEAEMYAELNHVLAQNGASKIWHPTVLKFDESTLNTSVKHTSVPGRTLNEIAVIDLGVIIDDLEIDCGDSFGFTPSAQRLVTAMHDVFDVTKQKLLTDFQITSPAELYEFVSEQAKQRGFMQIAPSAGHLVGPYPTPKRDVKITPTCEAKSFPEGWWMIEIYLGDGVRGAFFEDCVYL